MKIVDYRKDILHLAVFDKMNMRTDVNLGSVELSIKKIVDRNCFISGWCPLDGERGKLLVKIRFLPAGYE